MQIPMNDPLVELISIEGVWHDLFPMCSWCAEERGSKSVEPIDLIKAIYIMDLEHVSSFWDDWQHFEKFILSIPLANGGKVRFINRMERLITVYLERRERAGEFIRWVSPSHHTREVVFAARELARIRDREGTPSSPELLYCACSLDGPLAESLRQAGLQIEKLRTAVNGPN